jgi:uncharacterized protein (TIGR03067 family)
MTCLGRIGFAVSLLALAARVAPAADAGAPEKASPQLQGAWLASEGTRDGQPLTKEELAPFQMVLGDKGGRLGGQDAFAGGGPLHNLAVQFDLAASPQRLYLLRPTGLRYTTYPGIFQLDGDRLIVCLNLEPWTSPDGPALRPTPQEFAAPKGSGLTLLTFQKTGDAEDPRGLVDKLATTNPRATIRGEPGDEQATWEKLDFKEAKRVDAAVKEVIRRSEELWPELVAHLGDDRYCKTVGIDAGYPRNYSVADICQHIIGETLSEPYYRHLEPASKETFHRFRLPAFAKDKAKLRQWCLARKDRQLYELQIEACQWAIDEIEGSDNGTKEEPPIVTAIKKEIESLKKNKMAMPSKIAF